MITANSMPSGVAMTMKTPSQMTLCSRAGQNWGYTVAASW